MLASYLLRGWAPKGKVIFAQPLNAHGAVMPNAVSLPLELQDYIAKQNVHDRSSLQGMLAASAEQFVFTLPLYLKQFDIDSAGFNIILSRLRLFILRQPHFVAQKWLIGISKAVENKAIFEENYYAKALLAYLYALELKIIAQGELETDSTRKPELQSKLTLLSLDSAIKKHVASAMMSLLSPADYQAKTHSELSVFFLGVKQTQAPSHQQFQIILDKFSSAMYKIEATAAIAALTHMPDANTLDRQQLAALLTVVFYRRAIFYENVNFIQEIIAFLKPQILKFNEYLNPLLERLLFIVANTDQNCDALLTEIRYFSSALESNQTLLEAFANTLLNNLDYPVVPHAAYFIAHAINPAPFIEKLLLNLQKRHWDSRYLVINSMTCLSELLQLVRFSESNRATFLAVIIEKLTGNFDEIVTASIRVLPKVTRFFNAAQVRQLVDILVNLYQKLSNDHQHILTALYACTLTPFLEEWQRERIVEILIEAIKTGSDFMRDHAIGLMDRYLTSSPQDKLLANSVTKLLLDQISWDEPHKAALIFLQKHAGDSLSDFIKLLAEGVRSNNCSLEYKESLICLIPQLVDPQMVTWLMEDFAQQCEAFFSYRDIYPIEVFSFYANIAPKLAQVLIKNQALLENVEIQNLFYSFIYVYIDVFLVSRDVAIYEIAKKMLAAFLPYMAKARGTGVIIEPTIDGYMQNLEGHQQSIMLENLSHLEWLISASAACLEDPASCLNRNRGHIQFAYNREWPAVKMRDKVHSSLTRIVATLFLYCSEANADVTSFEANLNSDVFLEALNNHKDLIKLLDQKNSAYIDQLLQLIDLNLGRTQNAELKNQTLSILIAIAFIHPDKRERVVNSIQRVEQTPMAYQQISRLIIAGLDDPQHIPKNITSVIVLKIIEEAYQEYRAGIEKKNQVIRLFCKPITVVDDVYTKTFLSKTLDDIETLDDRLASTILGLAGTKFAETLRDKIKSTIPAGMLASLTQTAAVLNPPNDAAAKSRQAP